VRDHLDDLGPETVVVMVTFTEPDRLLDYRRRHDLPFPVLIDRQRTTYRAYGLGRGRVMRVWGRRAIGRYIELVRANGLRGVRAPREDSLQLGGDFVVAPDGTLAWGFWSEGPDDRPDVSELIGAVAACTG